MRYALILTLLVPASADAGGCFKRSRVIYSQPAKVIYQDRVIEKVKYVPQEVNNFYSPPVPLQAYAQVAYQQDKLAYQQIQIEQQRIQDHLEAMQQRQQQYAQPYYPPPQYQQPYAPPQQYQPQYAPPQQQCQGCQQQSTCQDCAGSGAAGPPDSSPSAPSPPFDLQAPPHPLPSPQGATQQHCQKCHGAQRQQGDVRFDQPLDDQTRRSAAGKVLRGEMPPPEGGDRLSPEQIDAVLDEILTEAEMREALAAFLETR